MVNPLIPGTYKLSDSKNFDEFLKKIGVGLIKRQVINVSSATITIVIENDIWHIKTYSKFKNSELKFRLGEEFTEDRQDGIQVQSVFTIDENNDNVLKQVQKGGKSDVTITRTFTEQGLETICETDGVTATRYYTREK